MSQRNKTTAGDDVVGGPFPEADYDVGYAKPPASGQFQKGRSGNPAGRPPKPKKATIATVRDQPSTYGIGDVAYAVVRPVIDGKEVPMTRMEALHNKRFAVAMKGENRLLMREIIAEANAYEEKTLDASISRYLRCKDQKHDGYRQLAAAAAAGRLQPELLPHPDDIVLDEVEYTFTIEGPETRTELAGQNFTLGFRDFLVMRWVYARRFGSPFDPHRKSTAAFEQFATMINKTLPARLRWNGSIWWAAEPYARVGIREMDQLMHKQRDGLKIHRAAMRPLAKRDAVHIDKYLRWRPRSYELLEYRRMAKHAGNVARLIAANPRVAEEFSRQLTAADLPWVYAKVPDLIALIGYGVAADGSLRRLKTAEHAS